MPKSSIKCPEMAVSNPESPSIGPVRAWLIAVAVLIAAMVLVGGATRLTESGLSIVEWKPVTGSLPPLSEAEWTKAFEAYKTIPQYRQMNAGMSLPEFKTIFWWEWSHRLLGRVIGAVYLANGWQKVMELVDHHFAAALEGVADGRSGYDYKTRLQEEIQNRLRLAPKYRVISETGPDHEKTFEVEVAVNPDLTARGTGRSKKEAEQAAARALSQLLSATEK